MRRRCLLLTVAKSGRSLFGCLLLAAIGVMESLPARAAERRFMSMGCIPPPAAKDSVVTDGIRITYAPPQYGFIDRTGKYVPLPKAEYNHLCRFQEGLAAVEIRLPDDRDSWGPQRWGFLDHNGRWAIPAKFQYADDFREGLACVNVGGRPFGGADPDSAVPMVDKYGRHFVYPVHGGKWGFINKRGEFVIEPVYDHVNSFSEGLAAYCEGGKWGYMDAKGKHIIPAQFDSAGDFSRGVAQVWDKELQARYIDKSGASVKQPATERPASVSEDLTPVETKGKWGYADKQGKTAIAQRFVGAGLFRDGIARVATAGRVLQGNPGRVYRATWGYIDRTGKFVIPPQFDEALDFWEGKAVVCKYAKFGLADAQGKEIVAACYDEIGVYNEGLVPVYKNGSWGFIDPHTGRVAIPPRFDHADAFSCGRAAVSEKGKWGFIDKSGEYVVKAVYAMVSAFSEDLAAVYGANSWGYIDARGKTVIRPQFAMAGDFCEGLAAASPRDKKARARGEYGYIDKTGKFVIEPRFTWADDFADGKATVSDGKKEYKVDAKGNLQEVEKERKK